MASANSEIESVWTYNAVTESWYIYSNDGISNDDMSSMEAGKAYWIKAKENGTMTGEGQLTSFGGSSGPGVPTGISLAAGWNLIGYYQLPDKTTSPIASALSKLDNLWSGSGEDLLTYNNVDGSQTLIKPIDTMTPGKGYWIFMNTAGVYTFPNE